MEPRTLHIRSGGRSWLGLGLLLLAACAVPPEGGTTHYPPADGMGTPPAASPSPPIHGPLPPRPAPDAGTGTSPPLSSPDGTATGGKGAGSSGTSGGSGGSSGGGSSGMRQPGACPGPDCPPSAGVTPPSAGPSPPIRPSDRNRPRLQSPVDRARLTQPAQTPVQPAAPAATATPKVAAPAAAVSPARPAAEAAKALKQVTPDKSKLKGTSKLEADEQVRSR